MKRHRFKFGLRWKLNLLLGTVVFVTMSVFESVSLYRERQILIDARAQHLQGLAEHLAWMVQSTSESYQSVIVNYERGINGDRDRGQRSLILDAEGRIVAATNTHSC